MRALLLVFLKKLLCGRKERKRIPRRVWGESIHHLRAMYEDESACLTELRCSVELFRHILHVFQPLREGILRRRPRILSPADDLALCLWFLSHGTEGTVLSVIVQLPHSTRSDHFRKSMQCLLQALRTMPDAQFGTPPQQDMIRYASMMHAQYPHILNCVGFMDCTVVQIARPRENGRMYFDGHHHCYATKAGCLFHPDGTCSIAAIGFPGSVHDSRCVLHGGIYNEILTPAYNHYVVLADSAFRRSDRIITPLSVSLPRTMCSTARVAVEWAFKDLKQKFRVLSQKIRSTPKGASAIMECCLRLNNLCCRFDGRSHLLTFFS